MSGQPDLFSFPVHRTGTTWLPVNIRRSPGGVPDSFAGARARMVAVDGSGASVIDYDTDDALKPGLAFYEDPDTGLWWLRVVGDLESDGTLVLPAGSLTYDLKLWLATGEIAVDIYGEWQIVGGPTP